MPLLDQAVVSHRINEMSFPNSSNYECNREHAITFNWHVCE